LLDLQKSLPNLDFLDDEVDEDNIPIKKRKQKVKYSKDDMNADEQFDVPYHKNDSDDDQNSSGPEIDMNDSDNENLVKTNDFYESDEETENPLLAKLAEKETETKDKKAKNNLWFNKVKKTTKKMLKI
jgi:hypothetical protein